MIYILAPHHQVAMQWCKDNDINPYSRDVRIILRPEQTHGIHLKKEDRVKVIYIEGTPMQLGLMNAWAHVELTKER